MGNTLKMYWIFRGEYMIYTKQYVDIGSMGVIYGHYMGVIWITHSHYIIHIYGIVYKMVYGQDMDSIHEVYMLYMR
jgi:S-ribosylhomocysteine lyase LuxS involved in autoinducer biosynthesis